MKYLIIQLQKQIWFKSDFDQSYHKFTSDYLSGSIDCLDKYISLIHRSYKIYIKLIWKGHPLVCELFRLPVSYQILIKGIKSPSHICESTEYLKSWVLTVLCKHQRSASRWTLTVEWWSGTSADWKANS